MTKGEGLVSWVMTPGAAGMENQALGLAEAMGLTPQIIRLSVPKPWHFIPPQAHILASIVLGQSTPKLTPPWPDLIIACGRRVILPTLAIARASGGKTRTVYLQDPRIPAASFDRVVVPGHDRLRGPNVLVTSGALHRMTPARLAAAAADQATVKPPPGTGPVVAVLIGGRSKAYELTDADIARIIHQLDHLRADCDARLLITTSRRTGEQATAKLASALDQPSARFWSPDDPRSAPNPLFPFLHHADAILVTGDSVSMLSEACSLGKPVGILALTPKGRAARKIESFARFLMDKGAATPFDGTLPPQPAMVLDEPQRIAQAIWSFLEKSKR